MNIIKCTLQAGGIGIWKCWFLWREEKPESPEKNSRSKDKNKLNPRMPPGPGIEPGPHWWEASVLTTAPSLLPPGTGLSYKLSKKTSTSYRVQ